MLLVAALLAVQVDAAVAPATLTPEQVVVLAERLLTQGRVDDASVLVEELATHGDGGTQRRFLQALIAGERRQYALAATIFRGILRNEPGVARVRLELARVLFLSRDWSAADYHFRLADAAADLPAATRAVIRQFRNQIRANRVWTANLELGIAPDTNINQGSGTDTAVIYGRPFVLGADARAKTGVGVTLTASGEMRMRRRPESAVVISGFTAITEYEGATFDDYLLGGEIGREQRAGRGRVTLSATGFRRWYGNRPYAIGYGLRGQYEAPPTRWQTAYQATVQRIVYDAATLQTGWSTSLGVAVSHALTPTSFGSMQVTLSRQSARDPGYAYVDGRVSLGYARELPLGLSGASEVSISRTGFDAALPAYGLSTRRDWRMRAGFTLAKRDWLFAGFAPAVRLTQSLLRSNVSLFDYDRRRFELTVVRPF